MNFEEGFRRIGIAVLTIALVLGAIAFVVGGPVLSIWITAGVVIVGYSLIHAAVYVAKGFMKKTDESKNEDQAL